jgi:hypothetical protein
MGKAKSKAKSKPKATKPSPGGKPGGKPAITATGTKSGKDCASICMDIVKERCHFIRGLNGAFVSYKDKDGVQVVASMESGHFEKWLRMAYWKRTGKVAHGLQFDDVILQCYSCASETPEADEKFVFSRVGVYAPDDGKPLQHQHGTNGGATYLRLGRGRFACVTSSGWKLVSDCPCLFKEDATRDLEDPVHGGSLEEIRYQFNLSDENDWHKIQAWLVTCFFPFFRGLPILVFNGSKSTGKSWMQMLCGELIDPTMKAFAQGTIAYERGNSFKEEKDFVMALDRGGWVFRMGNIDKITTEQSSTMCGIAQPGFKYSMHELYVTAGLVEIGIHKPQILGGIPDNMIRREDLADRVVTIHPPEMSKSKMHEFNEDEEFLRFIQLRPRLLGALLDLVAAVLKFYESGDKASRSGRFGGFDTVCTAIERHLKWERGSMQVMMQSQKAETSMAMIENMPWLDTLLTWVKALPLGGATVTPAVLLNELRNRVDKSLWKNTLPDIPGGMGTILMTYKDGLLQLGVKVTKLPRTKTARPYLIEKIDVPEVVPVGAVVPVLVPAPIPGVTATVDIGLSDLVLRDNIEELGIDLDEFDRLNPAWLRGIWGEFYRQNPTWLLDITKQATENIAQGVAQGTRDMTGEELELPEVMVVVPIAMPTVNTSPEAVAPVPVPVTPVITPAFDFEEMSEQAEQQVAPVVAPESLDELLAKRTDRFSNDLGPAAIGGGDGFRCFTFETIVAAQKYASRFEGDEDLTAEIDGLTVRLVQVGSAEK